MQRGASGRCRGKRLSRFSSTRQKSSVLFLPSSGRPEAASQKSEAFQLINSADKSGVSAGKFRKDNLRMQGLCSAACQSFPAEELGHQFGVFLHLCFLWFLNRNSGYQRWFSRVYFYWAWSVIFIFRVSPSWRSLYLMWSMQCAAVLILFPSIGERWVFRDA